MRLNFRRCAYIVLIIVSTLSFVLIMDAREVEIEQYTWLPSVEPLKSFEDLIVDLPGAYEKRAVKIYDENDWQVYRSYPSGHLDVFFDDGSGIIKRVDLSVRWRLDIHPMLLMSTSDRLFVVGYDVVRNIPSGRSLSVTEPGLDLFEITFDTHGEPRTIAKALDLGAGIDSVVYGRLLNSKFSICAEKNCVDVAFDGSVRPWPTSILRDYEFIELVFGTEAAYAIVRKSWDDRINGRLTEDDAKFYLASLRYDQTSIEPISTEHGIPFELTVHHDTPVWNVANNAESARKLFLYEISRMRNGGLIDYGENNLEGRLAWSQAYYLNGLISIIGSKLAFVDDDLKSYVRQRLMAELDLTARLSEADFPGYRVKRYSIEREPLVFALHLGRIAYLLARAEASGLGSPSLTHAIEGIKNEMLSFNNTVEHPVECRLSNEHSCKTLAYRQGYPFWADGINVPYNYVSGYVSGLLSIANDATNNKFSTDLMRAIIVQEELHAFPEQWRYWWAQGQEGWDYSDGNSINTPVWNGNALGLDIAHITYRTMDAMALVMLDETIDGSVDADLIQHIVNLVSEGMLLPTVNERLEHMNLRVPLEPLVWRRFSRSSQAWQIQSQVWALSDLVDGFERTAHHD